MSDKIKSIKCGTQDIKIGIDTSDATATINDIFNGKTAYVNNEKVTGTYEVPQFKYGTTNEGNRSTFKVYLGFKPKKFIAIYKTTGTTGQLSPGGYIKTIRIDTEKSVIYTMLSTTNSSRDYWIIYSPSWSYYNGYLQIGTVGSSEYYPTDYLFWVAIG